MSDVPESRLVVALDVERYTSRPGDAQDEVRRALDRILPDAFEEAGLDWKNDVVERQSRGDGDLLVLPRRCLGRLLDPFVFRLDRELRRYRNRGHQPLRMRMAVHCGPIHEGSLVGPGKNVACRIVEEDRLREILRRYTPASLVLAVSDATFQEAVRPGYTALEPEWFAPVETDVKSYRERIWVHVVGRHEPTDLSPASADPAPTPAPTASAVAPAAYQYRVGRGSQVVGTVYGGVHHLEHSGQGDIVSGHKGDIVHGRKGDDVQRDKRVHGG